MRKMFIDGEFVASLSGETFAVENPATEEIIDDVPRARAEDADRAVLAAVKAQDDWRFVPGIEKCELLHAAARNMREHREQIATLMTQEGGKPLIEN
ncbi:MAG: aldehyde dehydrogenase, partial [Acidobacteria bacterium]